MTSRVHVIAIAATLTGRCTAPVVSDLEKEDGVIWTSLVQVLAHPEKYHGKKIMLQGYYRSEFEHSALYLTKDDADNSNCRSGIWVLRASWDPTTDKVNDRSYVRAIGVFSFDTKNGNGHMGLWPGELRDVTAFTKMATTR